MPLKHAGGRQVQLYHFLISAEDGGEWSTPHPIALCTGKAPVTIAGFWLGSRVGMDGFSRSENHIPPPGIEHLTVQLVEGRYSVYTSNVCTYMF